MHFGRTYLVLCERAVCILVDFVLLCMCESGVHFGRTYIVVCMGEQ